MQPKDLAVQLRQAIFAAIDARVKYETASGLWASDLRIEAEEQMGDADQEIAEVLQALLDRTAR